MSAELEGKRALVTGAARGLGRAISELFIERGARVVLSDMNIAECEQTVADIGAQTTAIECDVTDSQQVQAMVAAATAELGGLDILVNNAGIEIGKPMPDHTDEDFRKIFDVNVYGTFLCSKHSVPALADGGGAIVNISSVSGLGGAALLSAYGASKAAVIGFTQTCAVELRDAGIRVNAVCPAFIDTAMVDRLIPIYEEILPVPFDEVVKLKQGRIGESVDVAEMVAFLASDEASWTTGSHYVLDGGLSASLL
ncbi:MAG: SDR family oxidoreductase [Thermoleophilaceae bacterium]|nr:SDR family oxidoreductase [Thermoleophilaceae bacterium]